MKIFKHFVFILIDFNIPRVNQGFLLRLFFCVIFLNGANLFTVLEKVFKKILVSSLIDIHETTFPKRNSKNYRDQFCKKINFTKSNLSANSQFSRLYQIQQNKQSSGVRTRGEGLGGQPTYDYWRYTFF